MENLTIVKDLMTLKSLPGVVLHPQTNKKVKWYGQTHTAWYVQDAPYTIYHNGITYVSKYVSGCFYPYIFRKN